MLMCSAHRLCAVTSKLSPRRPGQDFKLGARARYPINRIFLGTRHLWHVVLLVSSSCIRLALECLPSTARHALHTKSWLPKKRTPPRRRACKSVCSTPTSPCAFPLP